MKYGLRYMMLLLLAAALSWAEAACDGDVITTTGYVINWTEWGERYGISNPFLIISGPAYQTDDGETPYYGLYNFPQYADAGKIALTGCVARERSPYRGLKYFSEVYDVRKLD